MKYQDIIKLIEEDKSSIVIDTLENTDGEAQYLDKKATLTSTTDDALVQSFNGSVNDEQYEIRNEYYSDLLKKYIDTYTSKSKWNKGYKLAFFIITLIIFLAIIGFSVYSILIIALNGKGTYSDIAAAFSATTGIVSSIIVLPKIIAQHLFPINEDENMINLVKNMQLNDSKIRDYSWNNRDKEK